uniref:ribosomal protein L32 n=1 Tax=Galdieria phlegrea TaxID=1389228 RepID=UPI0023D8C784|nr:ribosomal protein L32 [Galdieria phlegrea]WDA99837.1 ribosomal protein L32 [Galdieria phlegrea]
MAVPKKRTSKSKSKSRRANWKNKARFTAIKALSLAKSVSKNESKFVLNANKDKK